MKEDRIIQQRIDAVFQKMASTILWQERRDQEALRELSGFLTRGPGEDAAWEIRFRGSVPGLRPGAVLKLNDGARWLVEQVVEESLGGETLFVAARVSALREDAELPDDVAALCLALGALLEHAAMPLLERDDAAEALARIPKLGADAAKKGYGARLKQRLLILRAAFKACPQTSHEARGLILRLEASLKRRGMA
jgi:hypothetical protein